MESSNYNENEVLELNEDKTLIKNKDNTKQNGGKSTVSLDFDMLKKITTLSLTALGGGYLVIPSKVGNIGIIWFLIFIVLVVKIMYFTSMIQIKLATITKIYNYTALMKYFMGKKWAKIHMIVLLIGTIGVSVLYILICKYLIIINKTK